MSLGNVACVSYGNQPTRVETVELYSHRSGYICVISLDRSTFSLQSFFIKVAKTDLMLPEPSSEVWEVDRTALIGSSLSELTAHYAQAGEEVSAQFEQLQKDLDEGQRKALEMQKEWDENDWKIEALQESFAAAGD